MTTQQFGSCLTTREAALYLAISESWLRQRRMTGNLDGQKHAPPYTRIGRAIRYVRADLDRWLAERSTHDNVRT
jgi:predicted DNA-binding transcriptional regulator AlpA